MARLNVHPASGFGDLLPGWFDVPQNPLTLQQRGITRVAGIGELLPGKFSIPQNPLRDRLLSPSVLAPVCTTGMGACGCGCNSASGMGAIDLSSLSDIANTDVMGFPLWGVVGAGVLAMMLMGGRGKGYREESARIRRKHPTTAGRLKRAAQAF